ncbi:right-handed parallel beta-helix repeat-containing protein [Streptomyces griseoluteus]
MPPSLYTFGGNPSAVLTTAAGDVVPDYPVHVRVAGTGALVTALFEADGTTPIAELRTNPAGSDSPGAIRVFKADVPAIEYEYNGASGPVRWYESGREVATSALAAASDALTKTGGGTVNAPVVLAEGAEVEGGATVDTLTVSGNAYVGGTLSAGAGFNLSGQRQYNPRFFGAVGDGTHNDAPALQAAITAASTGGGGWVVVPSGTYLLSTLPIRMYRNVRLTCMPGVTFVRGVQATMLLNGDSDQNYGGFTGHGNIIIEGGIWDMRGAVTGLTDSRMCMSFGHGERITVRDVEIRDVPGYHAIEINACKNVRIANSRFLGFRDPGGRDISEAVQIDMASDVGAFGGFGPYDATNPEDIEVSGCYFGTSGTAGMTAWPRGIGSHNARATTWTRDIRIIGNTFQGCLQYAVHGYNWRDVVVDGNTMRGCGSGVRMRSLDTSRTTNTQTPGGTQTSASQPMRNIAITGNTITDCSGYDDAINVEGETTGRVYGVTVTGNSVDNVTDAENGFRGIFCNDFTVAGNTITAADGPALSLQDCIGGTLTSNRVMQTNGSGVSMNNCTRVKVADNSISEPGQQGIWVVGGSVIQLEDNTITSASRAAAGAGYGIRASSGVADLRIVGNTVRRNGSGNEMAYALSITAACTGVRRFGNDFEIGSSGIIDDQSVGPVLSPFDLMGNLEEVLRPTGRWETCSRLRAGSSGGITSGTLYLVPIWLPKGIALTNLTFVSAGTAGATLTNQWFTLHDRNRVAVARTADAGSAAWAANTAKTLAIAQTTAGTATSYTTTYTGLHYLGIMVAGTTPPNLVGEGAVTAAVASASPGFGAANTAQTTPPTVTAGAFTAAAPSGTGVQAYAYAA